MAGIVLFFLAIVLIINKESRKLIFIHNGAETIKLFMGLSLIVPIIYKNWLGLMIGVGVMLGIMLGLYLRTVMTKELYEKMLSLICILSVTSAGYAIIEKALLTLISERYHSKRIASVFFHPNYFGTVTAIVIIICAYKFLTNQKQKYMYLSIAAINVVSMYLCKSMFAFGEVFIGLTVLFFVLKKYRLLAAWMSCAVVAVIMIFFLDVDIIPRLSDLNITIKLRLQIWRMTEDQIMKNPLLGKGFLTFMNVYRSYYRNQLIPHAHSLYLDLLLNFGIIGTVLFLWYFIKYYISLLHICFKEKNTRITALIIAVTAAALVHGITDLTVLWIQTLPLYLFLLSGLGAYEKLED